MFKLISLQFKNVLQIRKIVYSIIYTIFMNDNLSLSVQNQSGKPDSYG